MSTDLCFVFDTNVIISALLLRLSLSRKALDKAIEQGTLLVSQATIDELIEVLYRKHFDKYVTEVERIEFISALLRKVILVETTGSVNACRDPKDNKFLELALSGKASYIVSGDEDLLVLHPFQGIPVLTPRQFLDISWENIN